MHRELRGKTAVITGGAGLIGSFLADQLVAAGTGVIVVDDFSKGTRDNLKNSLDRIEIREGDLEDASFAMDALEGGDVVFHLASRAYGVGYGQEHHLELLRHNELVTNNVLEALARHKPEHALITSSSCVYDDGGPDTIPELPLFDGNPENVNRGYGWAKRFLEQKALLYSQECRIPMTIARPFNIYGERYRWVGEYSQAIPMLTKRVLDGDDPIVIWGSGNQRRSYVHAVDCARMMTALVAARHTDGPVNIGTEETVSIAELVRHLCALAGVAPAFVFDRNKPEGRFVKSADMTRFQGIVPGFSFSIDLDEGLRRMVGWYRRTFAGATDSASRHTS